jgi:Asp-tRNA(Asn)/Glu-tRNA(Gln) amidotransferase A subunit family amidase
MALIMAACSAESPREPFRFVEATIDDVHSALRAGQMSCVDIVEGYRRRIEAYDKPSGLNAIIFTNPKAIARARQIDERIAAGDELGPLFCIPVLLKDNFDTADMPTSGGSIALKESVPPDDAFMVRRLREADAIVIAKTNMAEWAFSPRQTVSSSYGRTANAYDLERVPAGSSGGTASATASSFGVIGMGSDTGNSIRGPSSHLALVGIRSTIGLTSRDGVIPLLFDRDIAGPMTRTVTDAAKVFNVVAGYDPADPYTELGRDRREADYTAFLDASALQGKRLGVLRALVDTDDADPEVVKVFEQALADLEAAGAQIVDPVEIDNLDIHLDQSSCKRFRYDMHMYLSSLGGDAPMRDVMDVVDSGQHSPLVAGGLTYFGDGPLDTHPADSEEPCLDFADNELPAVCLPGCRYSAGLLRKECCSDWPMPTNRRRDTGYRRKIFPDWVQTIRRSVRHPTLTRKNRSEPCARCTTAHSIPISRSTRSGISIACFRRERLPPGMPRSGCRLRKISLRTFDSSRAEGPGTSTIFSPSTGSVDYSYSMTDRSRSNVTCLAMAATQGGCRCRSSSRSLRRWLASQSGMAISMTSTTR